MQTLLPIMTLCRTNEKLLLDRLLAQLSVTSSDVMTPGHYNDVIMSEMASQITGVSVVDSKVCPGADKKNTTPRQRWPVNSTHKRPETRKKVSMWWRHHDMETLSTLLDNFLRKIRLSTADFIYKGTVMSSFAVFSFDNSINRWTRNNSASGLRWFNAHVTSL